MCCHGSKAKDHGVDRTPYQGDRKISYVSYHTRAISMGITKAESRTLIDVGRRAPRKGPPLPHARRRPSRARAYKRAPPPIRTAEAGPARGSLGGQSKRHRPRQRPWDGGRRR